MPANFAGVEKGGVATSPPPGGLVGSVPVGLLAANFAWRATLLAAVVAAARIGVAFMVFGRWL